MLEEKELMTPPNSKDWVDLPKPLACFTVVNTAMVNLNTGKIVRHYSTNTKIVVVQKCVTPDCTYYRTFEAAHHYLNYAFKASDFGLPNEKAPSVHSSKPNSLNLHTSNSDNSVTRMPKEKQISSQKVVSPKDGEGRHLEGWLKRIFRRNHGKAKNT